ncbi:MAG: YabP/YqfC family sporulation protein, partial [Clostridia bacterium]|nr:YabP/YqfC family sporulation protein [Clostridia bacterium]
MTKGFKEKIEKLAPVELPELLIPHIELCADERAVIEGCKGILSYSDETISLNCKH